MATIDKIQSVYDWMCEHADEDGFLSANGRMVSEGTKIPTRTCLTYLNHLSKAGWVHILERNPDRDDTGNTTRWAVTELAELD